MSKILTPMALMFALLLVGLASDVVSVPFMGTESDFERRVIERGGQDRQFWIKHPTESNITALVIGLHGYGESVARLRQDSQFEKWAADSGFLIVYPVALKDYKEKTYWNSNLFDDSVDDVGFISTLINKLQTEYDIADLPVLIFGYSNGGYMGYTLACEIGGQVDAIASVTGTMSGYDWTNCEPEEATAVLQVNGARDVIVPLNGPTHLGDGFDGAPAIQEIIEYWSIVNSCQERLASKEADYQTIFYSNCRGDRVVELWIIENWGHRWPAHDTGSKLDSSELIVKFFSILLQK